MLVLIGWGIIMLLTVDVFEWFVRQSSFWVGGLVGVVRLTGTVGLAVSVFVVDRRLG